MNNKTLVTKKFSPWLADGTNGLSRTSRLPAEEGAIAPTVKVKVNIQSSQIFVSDAQGRMPVNPTTTGASLVDALMWADAFIADNYEVQKSAKELLDEALARILELETQLAAKPATRRVAAKAVAA